jgi:serine/threonine protein kinase
MLKIFSNLTPENITVNKTGLVRVQGFSCARPRSSTCALDDISKSSLYFRSPEILLGYNHIDTSSDLWSLGCVIVQLLKRKVLFQGTGVLDQIERIVNLLGKPDLEDVLGTNQAVQHVISIEAPLSEGSENPFKMLLESTNPLLVDLISGLLVFNPEKRLNALQAMRHPFFMGLHREANVTWSPQEFKFDLTPEQMDPDLLKEEMYRVVKSSRILSADSLFKSAS